MSKGSGRRKENTALVEANWPFPDRKAGAPLREGFGWAIDSAPVTLTPITGANRNTEQDAKDGQ